MNNRDTSQSRLENKTPRSPGCGGLRLRGGARRRAQRTMPASSEQELLFHRIGAGRCDCSLSDIEALQLG